MWLSEHPFAVALPFNAFNLDAPSAICYTFRKVVRPSAGSIADGAWLLPSFLQKGVMIMTDYEMLAIVLLIITLAFTIHIGNHK